MRLVLVVVVGLVLLFSISHLPALLNVIFLVAIIAALVRFFAKGWLPGEYHGGVGMAFVAAVFLWPFQVALWLLCRLHAGRRQRINLAGQRQAPSLLSRAARRAAERATRPPRRARPYISPHEYDRRWRELRRWLEDDEPYDGPDDLLANVGASRHAWELS